MKAKARKTMGLVDKQTTIRLQVLERLMSHWMKNGGECLTDEEIRELCMLRARYKKEQKA